MCDVPRKSVIKYFVWKKWEKGKKLMVIGDREIERERERERMKPVCIYLNILLTDWGNTKGGKN